MSFLDLDIGGDFGFNVQFVASEQKVLHLDDQARHLNARLLQESRKINFHALILLFDKNVHLETHVVEQHDFLIQDAVASFGFPFFLNSSVWTFHEHVLDHVREVLCADDAVIISIIQPESKIILIYPGSGLVMGV